MRTTTGLRISNNWIAGFPLLALAAAAVLTPNRVLAVGPAAHGSFSDPSVTTQNVGVSETEAGDLVADAVRAESATDISFVPAAAFKPGASVPRPASADEATTLLESPTDTISVLRLRGDQIIAAIERSVSFQPQASSGFLQISGLRFSYDPKKEGGKRVASATVNGQPLEASKIYKVSTTKPLAIGGNGYFQIWEKSDIASDSTKSLETAIKDYVRSKNGSVSPALDGRIVQSPK